MPGNDCIGQKSRRVNRRRSKEQTRQRSNSGRSFPNYKPRRDSHGNALPPRSKRRG